MKAVKELFITRRGLVPDCCGIAVVALRRVTDHFRLPVMGRWQSRGNGGVDGEVRLRKGIAAGIGIKMAVIGR